MVKLMFYLIKSYVMLIVQTVTAPVQILMNAMPGSKAFGEWVESIRHTPSLSAQEVKALIDQQADMVVLDARRIDAGPVARILLPHLISSGTHSCWADARDITTDWPGLF